jgi:hypothetical protein
MSTTSKMEREDGGPDRYQCDNCGVVWLFCELQDMSDLTQRIDPGGEVPAGECPDDGCQALCYPEKETPAPEELRLYRIAVQMKESDRRTNAVVWRYVVLATSLPQAKAIAVATRTDSGYQWDDVGRVYGHVLESCAYQCDNYGEKDRAPRPETVPSREEVEAARLVQRAYEAAHAEPEEPVAKGGA